MYMIFVMGSICERDSLFLAGEDYLLSLWAGGC